MSTKIETASEMADNGSAGASFREVAKESLSPGAAKLLDALQELGVGVAGLADEAAARVKETLGARGEAAGERAMLATQATRDKAGEVLRQTETFIRERPFTALGIAFLAGYLISGRR